MRRPLLATTFVIGCVVLGAGVATYLGRGPDPARGGAGIHRVAFPAPGPVYRITLVRQVTGRLVLGRAPEDRAEARVVEGGASLRVEPDGLRVSPEDAWIEVEVRVPMSVEEARVEIPGQAPRAISLDPLGGVGDGTLRIPLSEP